MRRTTMPFSAERLLRALVTFSLAASAALGACAPSPTPSPTPGPAPRVAVTLAFAPLVLEWARSYAEATGPLAFDLELVHAAAALEGLVEGNYEVAIGALEPQEGWFATPLASDPIAVVTGSGVREVTSAQLAGLLTGLVTDWSALGGPSESVQPVIPLPGDDLRAVIDSQLLKGSPCASASRLVASPEQALALLAENPAAIALVPLSALPGEAAPLSLDGSLPPASGYPLVAEVLAAAPNQPDGPVRAWLAWIQASQSP